MIQTHQVSALVLRYLLLNLRSAPRILEMIFWPMMDLLVWGFVTMYLIHANPDAPKFFVFLIGAMIFWDILYRSSQGVTMSFLEDVWSRNLLNVFVAPIRIREFIAATYVVGILKISFIVLVLTGMAYALYSYNLFEMGLYLAPFFASLMLMGWAMGMFTVGLVLRWGLAAEGLAWGIPFLVQPISAVFYPLDILPAWIQPFALAVPSTHVFEGMREVIRTGAMSPRYLGIAFGLNLLYLAAAGIFFRCMFNVAREKGLLVKLATQ